MRFPRAGFSMLALAAAGCGSDAREPSPSVGATPAAGLARSAEPSTTASAAQAKARATPPQRAPSRPSIGALDSRVFVRASPSAKSPEIGILHVGAVVPLRRAEPAGKQGCTGGWYAVEPQGFVCLDSSTTLDVESDPVIAAKARHHGRFDRPVPFQWSASREALLYQKLPSLEEQKRHEFQLAEHLASVERLRTARAARDAETKVPRALIDVDVRAARGTAPSFLDAGAWSPVARGPVENRRPRARYIPTRSTIAWTDEFVADGRTWVLTDDLLIAPKDKLVPLEPSSFAGVHLDDLNVRLPLAFVRFEPRPKFRLAASASDLIPVSFTLAGDDESADEVSDEAFKVDPLAGFQEDDAPGELVPTNDPWPRLSFAGLTGRYRKQGRDRYVETSDGHWMRERDATIVEERAPRGFELSDGEKWIDISIFKGTLVAYEGDRAVFATLISPGANGYKRIDGLPDKYTTPTGTFRIEWKHRSTTMSPDPERRGYYLSEVPYTQFFHMPFALHSAYWHDRFGEPKSGGCVNLSPKDAKWLFDWTLPHVPATWHSVRSGDSRGVGTWVRVR